MRTITIFALFLVTGILKAQSLDLINNTWYLQKIIYSNGTETNAPNNTEVSNIPTNFGDTQMHTTVVNDFLAFKFGGNAITSMTMSYDEFWYNPNSTGCQIPENCAFQNNYYFFLGYGFPMGYQITNENNYLKLILTNNNGNQAIYYSQTLSINETEKTNLKVFPNPVRDILNISTQQSKLKVQLYDMQGKLILHKNINVNNNYELNITDIVTGNYILNIRDSNDKIIYTSKVIKN